MLTVQGISARYDELQVLWDVSMEIGAGERVGLLGANGAGKSTTLATIMGMKKVIEGEVTFLGVPCTNSRTPDIVEAGMALVPEGRQLFPSSTVAENLRMGSFLRSRRAVYADRLEYVFDLFPILKAKAKQPAGELSGGQQQMVSIGRALMSVPKLLLLDEPFIGVAPIVVEEVLNALRRISSEGVTILLVEQNIHRALSFVDRAYIIDNGRTNFGGTAQELRDDEGFAQKFLGLE